jgi:glutamyl-Q tRNA(Asp) synthetase
MTLPNSAHYVGRFAPSPTGPLHFGSAVAAIASYLDARAHQGTWLVRIEDLDPPREQPGADDLIIEALSTLGMASDLPVVYQSHRHHRYLAALNQLQLAHQLYPCGCTRREIGPRAYPGTCRNGLPPGKIARSQRFIVPSEPIEFFDASCGKHSETLSQTVGDFNLRRADGLFSYHLAVVLDDAEQGVTHVVRGRDLLSSTARQIALQNALGYPRPSYLHFPVVCDIHGIKLSKQAFAKPLDFTSPRKVWLDALNFLKQPMATSMKDKTLDEIMRWAIERWQPQTFASTAEPSID